MIVIDRTGLADRDTVLSLVREFATSFFVDEAGFSNAFSQVLDQPHMHLAVARSDGVVIGYVLGTMHPTFYASGPVAWVEEIMVREDFRRRGVGKQLMQNFEEWAADGDCRVVALATRRAADFYKSLGYADSATYFRKIMKSPAGTPIRS